MNREQWQQKRGRTRTSGVPGTVTLAEAAHRVEVADHAAGATKAAASVGGQTQVEVSVVAVRHSKP